MRISDWSSDVCSSDLLRVEAGVDRARGVAPRQRVGGVGVAAATEAVARELVEQQEQRQRAVGAVHPGFQLAPGGGPVGVRSEEHTSELQSLMRISYAVFCLKKKTNNI